MKGLSVAGVLVATASALAAPPDPWAGGPGNAKAPAPVVPKEIPAPDIEAKPGDTTLALPPIPSFDPPPEPSDGTVDPRYLRIKGRKLLDTTVKVRGYVIWIYSCVDDVRRPKESRAAALQRIDGDPTLCERPKLYLGARKTTPIEQGLWVVDVPRPPNKLEKERLPKEELAAWPKVPKIKVGDYVELAGEFKLASPHNERNSDGLVVYASVTSAKPPAPAKPKKPSAAEPAPLAPPPTVASAPTPTPPRKAIDPRKRDESLLALAKGNRAHGQKRYEEAIATYRAAIAAWDENHLAWYGMGGAFAGTGDWQQAFDSFEHARGLRPGTPMYEMWSGVAAYEAAVKRARDAEAKRQGRKPEDVSVDLGTVSFTQARERLEAAVALDAGMWRAHYYLGRVYRAADLPRRAAEELQAALMHRPTEQGPFIALGELYRKWDYTKEAVALMTVGVAHVTPDEGSSDVYFVLGMANDDLGARPAAIEAFTKALDVKPTNHKARFQRGQAYYRTGKLDKAREDLEAFMTADAPSLAFARQQATKMLADIEEKKPAKK